ncbi:hypothetical protein M0R45_009250 [Rubus argutus]|uniref:Uncharacterized protein n=1 Tax=Rubus argutus TaxID=59490 RepID=A0AAW1Y601_RUBAR
MGEGIWSSGKSNSTLQCEALGFGPSHMKRQTRNVRAKPMRWRRKDHHNLQPINPHCYVAIPATPSIPVTPIHEVDAPPLLHSQHCSSPATTAQVQPSILRLPMNQAQPGQAAAASQAQRTTGVDFTISLYHRRRPTELPRHRYRRPGPSHAAPSLSLYLTRRERQR